MNRLSSLLNHARTPMTSDEKGAIKRSARMGVYVVIRVLAFVLWLCADLWLTTWAALIVIPRMGRFVKEGLGVTSKNSPNLETFISDWLAPLLLITIVVAAGVVMACVWLWQIRGRLVSVVRRWVDRAVLGEDKKSDNENDENKTVIPPLGTAKEQRSKPRRRSRSKKH